jgi:hypothetical protein
VEEWGSSSWLHTVRASLPPDRLGQLAALDGLWYVEPYDDPVSRNDDVRWVLQSFDAAGESTPLWDHGLHGENITIGCADTGIDYDHIMFRHNLTSRGEPGLDHRKIVQYNTTVHDWDDGSGHGTHVNGILAGDSVLNASGYDTDDAVAYNAKLAFYDVVLESGVYTPPNVTAIFDDAMAYGARSHSDSWGDDTTAYTTRCFNCDAYQWDHDEFLIFIAPGNKGPGPGTLLEPANAKNVVSVGNGVNGDSNSLAVGSSNGPSEEGLMGPTIVAPGSSIRSAKGDTDPDSYNSDYKLLGGTSMSTPAAASACALVEQYFLEGFYPSGARTQEDGFIPSGPLRKAVLVNSAWDMRGGSNVDAPIPDNSQGWGKILLNDTLYFDGDGKNLWLMDGYNDTSGEPGLTTGEGAQFNVWANGSGPLEITMCWNDMPGKGLMNDLDLTVTGPGETVYRGNVYSGGNSTTGGEADGVNTVECFFLPSPPDGLYTINVTAADVVSDEPQRFALVVTGVLKATGQGKLSLDRPSYRPDMELKVTLTDANLTGVPSVSVYASSGTEVSPETLTLGSSGAPGKFTGTILLEEGGPSSDGRLQVSHGDTIKVVYSDAFPPALVTATAVVDARPPLPANMTLGELTDTEVLISWDSDEPCTGVVKLGSASGGGGGGFILYGSTEGPDTHHDIRLESLSPNTTYFVQVTLEDALDNSASYNGAKSGGGPLNFTTYDLVLRPVPANMGFAVQGEAEGRFNGSSIRAGFQGDDGVRGGFAMDASSLPEDSAIVRAELRLLGRGRSGAASGTDEWSVFLLGSGGETNFTDTSGGPAGEGDHTTTSYDELGPAHRETALGDPLADDQLAVGEWNVLDLSDGETRLLEKSAADGVVAFSIEGPPPDGSSARHFSWETGFTPDEDTFEPRLSPCLALRLNPRPTVLPDAPELVIMQEDGWDNETLNVSGIFSDDSPMEELDVTITDPWGAPSDNLTFSIDPLGFINITVAPEHNGEELIRLRATDPVGSSAVHWVNVTVLPVNDPVSWRNLTLESDGTVLDFTTSASGYRVSAVQDRWFNATATAHDVDLLHEGDELTFSTDDPLVRFSPLGQGLMSFKPSSGDVGYRQVTLNVSDGQTVDSVILEFTVENVNDPPVASAGGAAATSGEAVQGAFVELDGSGSTDPDLPFGDLLGYSWTSNRSGELGAEEVANVTFEEAGLHLVTLTVTDRYDETSEDSFELLVLADLDRDGIPDREDLDDDGDGMDDEWETQWGLNPRDPSDAGKDPDCDGLTNLQEMENGTAPGDADTDGDGMPDLWEIVNGLNPLDPSDAGADPDGDGKTNLEEYREGTDPMEVETGDGTRRADTSPYFLAAVVGVFLVMIIAIVAAGFISRRRAARADMEEGLVG